MHSNLLDPNACVLIGLDWADREHAVCRLLPDGGTEHRQLEHTPEAIADWLAGLRKQFPGRPIRIALEQSRGALMNALRRFADLELELYPINPKQLARYRDAIHPSGAKSDPDDAHSWPAFCKTIRSNSSRSWRTIPKPAAWPSCPNFAASWSMTAKPLCRSSKARSSCIFRNCSNGVPARVANPCCSPCFAAGRAWAILSGLRPGPLPRRRGRAIQKRHRPDHQAKREDPARVVANRLPQISPADIPRVRRPGPPLERLVPSVLSNETRGRHEPPRRGPRLGLQMDSHHLSDVANRHPLLGNEVPGTTHNQKQPRLEFIGNNNRNHLKPT